MTRLLAALAAVAAVLNAIARVRVTLWPGWVAPLPSLVVAVLALSLAVLLARVALTLLARRACLPYIAVAVTWREAKP
jgi:hypothetical protein